MSRSARPKRLTGFACVFLLCLAPPSSAQLAPDAFVSGAVAAQWELWQGAMQAILERDAAKAEGLFGELLATEPSPLRVALLADRTVNQTSASGAVLLFEQDMEAKALEPNGTKIGELFAVGKEQMAEASDGWYFSSIGRFDIAAANFNALLAASPDPVGLLEFADRETKRRELLILLLDNAAIGDSARAILRLLDKGEVVIKSDPIRIKEHIERLGGQPRAFENSLARLKESGENAIPFMVQYLRDRDKRALLPAILRALPQIDRPALNPLVMALRTNDQAVQRHLIKAAGDIGYSQSLPYLLAIVQDPKSAPESKDAALAATQSLRGRGVPVDAAMTAADAFYQLAEDYYADRASLAADVRLDTANVWYWKDDLLENVEVPTQIFNEIMCMRCCEEALRLAPGMKPALALWLAANFRRDAQLAPDQADPTRPPNYPSPDYFAQSAGADYLLMVLARAVDDNDPVVALGAINALRKTAGPAVLVGSAERHPLAEALAFPDRNVRVRAGLALAYARPVQPFYNSQNLMPVLAEALLLHGGIKNALVVDPDDATANATAALLRAQGFDVLTDAGLFSGLDKVRQSLPGLDVIFLASDARSPDLATGLRSLRSEFRFAATPVIIVAKPGDRTNAVELARTDYRLGQVPSEADADRVGRELERVFKSVGAQTITPELGADLALDAAQALAGLGLTNNPVYDLADVETALLSALSSQRDDLRRAIAETLGYLGSTKAQDAIAKLALSTDENPEMRIAMFAALAEAAKRRGSQLSSDLVDQVVKTAESAEDLQIREAASQALGALNLPGEPAGVIIRNQYRG